MSETAVKLAENAVNVDAMSPADWLTYERPIRVRESAKVAASPSTTTPHGRRSTDVTVPVAFRLAATVSRELERAVRQECRNAFHAHRLMDRIIPDIKEVLGAGDDSGETAEEFEGRAVSLADGGTPGDLPGQSKPAGPG